MPQRDSSFSRAFVPGLVIGLIVGAIAGAVLPDLIAGPAVPHRPADGAALPTGSGDRDEREVDPGLIDPEQIEIPEPVEGENARGGDGAGG